MPITEPRERSTARAHSAHLLHASRRLDWRFLLPSPELGNVAYLGPAHAVLPQTLRLFSDSLTVLDTFDGRLPASGPYDLVVVGEPTYEALRQAMKLLRHDGRIYVEGMAARGPARWLPAAWKRRSGARLDTVADCMAAIGQLGFVDARPFWHWPDLQNCLEIVPLDRPAALTLFFGRRRKNISARTKATFGRLLVRFGLVDRAVSNFSVIARKY